MELMEVGGGQKNLHGDGNGKGDFILRTGENLDLAIQRLTEQMVTAIDLDQPLMTITFQAFVC